MTPKLAGGLGRNLLARFSSGGRLPALVAFVALVALVIRFSFPFFFVAPASSPSSSSSSFSFSFSSSSSHASYLFLALPSLAAAGIRPFLVFSGRLDIWKLSGSLRFRRGRDAVDVGDVGDVAPKLDNPLMTKEVSDCNLIIVLSVSN